MARQKYQTKRRCVYILLQVSPMGYPSQQYSPLPPPKKVGSSQGTLKNSHLVHPYRAWNKKYVTESGLEIMVHFFCKKKDTQHMVMQGMQDMLLYMNVVVLQTHLRLSVTT